MYICRPYYVVTKRTSEHIFGKLTIVIIVTTGQLLLLKISNKKQLHKHAYIHKKKEYIYIYKIKPYMSPQ